MVLINLIKLLRKNIKKSIKNIFKKYNNFKKTLKVMFDNPSKR